MDPLTSRSTSLNFRLQKLLQLLSLLLSSVFVIAAVYGESIKLQPHLNLRHFTVTDGLTSSVVYDFSATSDGFMWIATEEGINRFDGYQFKPFRKSDELANIFPDTEIYSLFTDSNDVLWIGTRLGVARKLPSDEFQAVSHFDNGRTENVLFFAEDNENRIWAIIGEELLIYSQTTNSFEPYQEVLKISTFAQQESVYTLHHRNNVMYFSNGDCLYALELKDYKRKKYCFGGDRRISIIRSKDNDYLWVGTTDGLVKFNITDGSYSDYQPSNNGEKLSSGWIHDILIDDQEQIWLATIDGLDRIELKTGKLVNFQKNIISHNGLKWDEIYRLKQDANGLIWIGTYGRGFHIYNPDKQIFKHYFTKEHAFRFGVGNLVHPVVTDSDNRLWFGTSREGVYRISPDRAQLERVIINGNDFTGIDINKLAIDYFDRLWIASSDGVFIIDIKSNQLSKLPINESLSYITYIIEDRRGDMWLGGYGSLFKVKVKRNQGKDLEVEDYSEAVKNVLAGSNYFIVTLTEDIRGDLWIGTDHGLVRFDPNDDKIRLYTNEPGNEQSISHNYIQSLYQDSAGTLWFGTSSGLNQLVEPTGNWVDDYFIRFGREQGFPGDGIYGIESMGDDSLWLATNNGLLEFKTSDFSLKHFDYLDGIQSNEFNINGSHQGFDGEIYFAGINGITAFNPDNGMSSNSHNQVQFTSARLNNEPVEVNDLNNGTVLITNNDYIRLELSTFDFDEQTDIEYRYRVNEIPPWFELGKSNLLSLYGLREGLNVIEVQSKRIEGRWGQSVSRINISTQESSFYEKYKTQIFVSVLSFIIVILILENYRRINKVKKKFERRLSDGQSYIKDLQLRIEQERSKAEELNDDILIVKKENDVYRDRLISDSKKDPLTNFYQRQFFEKLISSEESYYINNQLDIPNGCLICLTIQGYHQLVKEYHKANIDIAISSFADEIRNLVLGDDIICQWADDSFMMLKSGSINKLKKRIFNFYRMMANRQFDCGNGLMLPIEFSITVMEAPLGKSFAVLLNRSRIANLCFQFNSYNLSVGNSYVTYIELKRDVSLFELERGINKGVEFLIDDDLFEIRSLGEMLIKDSQ